MVQISSSAEGFALSSTLDSCRYKEASSYNCFVDISVFFYFILHSWNNVETYGGPLGWLNHHHRRFEKGFTMVEEEELGIAFCTRAKMRRQKARKKAITIGGSSFVGSTERRIHFFVFYRFLRSRISNLNCHLLKLSFSIYFQQSLSNTCHLLDWQGPESTAILWLRWLFGKLSPESPQNTTWQVGGGTGGWDVFFVGFPWG